MTIENIPISICYTLKFKKKNFISFFEFHSTFSIWFTYPNYQQFWLVDNFQDAMNKFIEQSKDPNGDAVKIQVEEANGDYYKRRGGIDKSVKPGLKASLHSKLTLFVRFYLA